MGIRKKTQVKAFLMDEKNVGGIVNMGYAVGIERP
jgi:hypothetical protein